MSEKEFKQLSLEVTAIEPGANICDFFEPGTKLKIKGERGVFIYNHASLSKSGLVSLHLLGEHGYRAVRPEQVTMVKKGGK